MRIQEAQDIVVAVIIGAIVSICLVIFVLQIPYLGLDEPYIYAQVIGFGMLIGILPVIGYNGKTAQGVMVLICLTMSGGILFAALLLSGVSTELKVLTLGTVVLTLAGAEASYRTRIPDLSVLFASVLVSAWVFAFCLVVILGLLSASEIPPFMWVGVIVGVATFAVLFDSLSREISEANSP